MLRSRTPERKRLHSNHHLRYREGVRVSVALLVALALAAQPALAGSTAWQEIAPGTRARLISSGEAIDGVHRAGLEIELPHRTKTYWRVPGETGVPMVFDFTASINVEDAEVLWPYPLIENDAGFRDYVYRGTVVIPFEFSATAPGAVLDASVSLGVCSEICVPVSARFTMPVETGQPDGAQAIRLDQAMRDVPVLWDQAGQPFATVEAGLDGSLHLYGAHSSIMPDSVIVDSGDPAVLFQTPQKSPDGRLWTVKPLGHAGGRALEGTSVQLTFLTPMGPYAVSRVVAPSQL
jgi:DsbC/DsbD-like thiol-disulfide interchange protein